MMTNEQLFKDFIKGVEGLRFHFNNNDKKTLKKFDFDFSFNTQYGTNEPLFCIYWTYNNGLVMSQNWTKDQYEQFNQYITALHDLAYAM